MKQLIIISSLFIIFACHNETNIEQVKQEIFQAEKAFEKMTHDKGVAEAFWFFADDSAVIKRETLIKGKARIKEYYEKNTNPEATVNWTPDFIEVSNCGTLGYTYGKYKWKTKTSNGEERIDSGVFHTVWKKQKNGSWKYVWD